MKLLTLSLLVGWSVVAVGQAQMITLPVRAIVEKKIVEDKEIVQQAKTQSFGDYTTHIPEICLRKQQLTMQIKMHNMSGDPLMGLKVRYKVVGTRGSIKDLVVVAVGEKTLDVPAMRILPIELEPINFVRRDTTYKHGMFNERNSKVGEQYYGVVVWAETDKGRYRYSDPKELAEVVDSLAVPEPATKPDPSTKQRSKRPPRRPVR